MVLPIFATVGIEPSHRCGLLMYVGVIMGMGEKGEGGKRERERIGVGMGVTLISVVLHIFATVGIEPSHRCGLLMYVGVIMGVGEKEEGGE